MPIFFTVIVLIRFMLAPKQQNGRRLISWSADRCDRVGMRQLACWDRGFESRRGPVCPSVVSVVCCQVEVSATSRSLVQRSPTECGASECDLGNSPRMGLGPLGAVEPCKK